MKIEKTSYDVSLPDRPIDLWLHSNEGPSPDASLLREFAETGGELVRRYPKAEDLEAQIGSRFGLSRNRVLVTAGADEALDRACRAFLLPNREVVMTSPTFEMIPRYVGLTPGVPRVVSWFEEELGSERVLAATGSSTAMVVLVTPNNPTGSKIETETLLEVAEGASTATVVVDLAYVEFDEADPTPKLLERSNVLVLRTFSKAWGLAGLRVGYALGDPELLSRLRLQGGPYSVAGPSVALASLQLSRGDSQIVPYVDRVRAERDEIFDRLQSLGARPFPSRGNFVLVRVGDAMEIRDALMRRGIFVRAFPGNPEIGDCLRITCPGSEAGQERLLRGLGEVLSSEDPRNETGGGS